ncbi:serine hydrolase domain-containing protein [Winogradskyella sp.]|uniref:serine hydrolase domain-containing protein n=1 Tax=Winogradskyella sp. TaxID=1883156 RepID=UPI003F6B5C5D
MKKICILFSLLISVIAPAQHQLKIIDSIIDSKIKESDPGIMVGIVQNGKVIFEKYRGLANLQHQVKITKKTRSNIASTAKQFTALMVLDLALNETLSLDDDIRKYLPKLYKKVEDSIKIRHLINHTSGIRDYVELLSLQGNIWWKQFGLDNDDVMALIEKQNDLGFKAGSRYSYSNSNYNILAKLIEAVTGKKFTDYSKQFFVNLGMNETAFAERYMGVIPNRAEPYNDWGYGEWFQTPTVTKTSGEGFLFTTLKDQLIYEQAVQNAISANNTLLIKSQQTIPNSEINTYGFGLELNNQLGHTSVYHSGGTYGYNSQVDRYTEHGITIFAMSNNGNISTNLISKEIAKILLPKSTKSDTYNNKYYDLKAGDETISIFGKYTYPNENSIVEILKKDVKLYWKEKNFTVEMISETNNSYAFVNNPKLKVAFYHSKMVEFYPSGKTMSYKRQNEAPVSLTDLEGLEGTYHNKDIDVSFKLKLTDGNILKFKLDSDENFEDVTVYNKTYLLADNYFLKTKRDSFNRVIGISFTYGRALNMAFEKNTNLKYQPKIETKNGYIQVTTIESVNGDASDILLTKNYSNGNEIWSQQFGGSSYDKASSILATDDGYLIIGSTSSYGNGNYDMFVIKTDKKGNKQWQNTYGDFYNEYGYSVEKTETGYLIKGTIQNCTSNSDVLNRECTTNVWFVSIDKNGKELSREVLETIN